MTLLELAHEISLLTDEQRREINALLIAKGPRYIADSSNIDGYRELGQKCADLEREKDTAVLAERERVLGLIEAELGLTVGSSYRHFVARARMGDVIRRIREGA